MSKYVVTDGDKLTIPELFDYRTVTLLDLTAAVIRGSGVATIEGSAICCVGDEKTIILEASYNIEGFSPGQGLVTIELASDQCLSWYMSDRPVIVVGGKFTATFTPTAPAVMTSPPNNPDTSNPTTAFGSFENSQDFVEAG